MNEPSPRRPRVVPGDRWDQHEIDDVVRQSRARDAQQVPYLYREVHTSVTDVTEWVDHLVTQALHGQGGYPSVRHGESLVLMGATGVGKTHNAFAAMQELSASGVQFRWLHLTAEDLFAKLRPRHGVDSEEEFQRVVGAGVLVLDEIGAHKGTEWTEVQLTRVINHRYQDHRPTLYVSNLTPEGFDLVVGERVASRLAECATEVVVGGPDRRRQGGAR